MRQAGRYLPAYRKIRADHSMKDICREPVLAAEISYDPVRELGVDAAIVFSDILLPLESMGMSVEYLEGTGPVVDNHGPSDLFNIEPYDPESDPFKPWETIRAFRKMHRGIPIIGFSGGPVTIASYAISGKSDRDLSILRKMMHSRGAEFSRFASELKEMIILNVKEQIKSGADAVQIFESWLGGLSRDEYSNYIFPMHQEILSEIGKVPTILFSTSSHHLFTMISETGTDFISVDWKESLAHISQELKGSVGLQGNLDPMLAQDFPSEAISETKRIMDSMKYNPRYIFNLGHGVLPNTDPDTLKEIVGTVHRAGAEK